MSNIRFRNSRYWSNRELRKIAPLLSGKVLNVSAWRDGDKEGGTYRENYFTGAASYGITNWKAEAKGFQGDLPGEIFLDLEEELPLELAGGFDVVFNHTTLEHVFEVFTAFSNLCRLSRDVVIVVVPFLQEQHAPYGDYWRFTPWAIQKLFLKSGLTPAYLNFNDGPKDAIYIFAAGARNPETAARLGKVEGNRLDKVDQTYLGVRFMDREPLLLKGLRALYHAFRRR
ncbi:hypothetical protein KP001_03130 [Geomonas subterranea]|uniref:Methyltransferase domain-containing protein n=1 Tax=Geomonas subterranea TaxID=2847989 RepID=A0ABX8LLI2_9BACT|nr:hypothetical protein [Geomonas subterranea]QXE91555.1 hypothetical protein KP001_03130 [Geomonas subterranea]QXM10356.1 hypothetical protein KP002_04365 [Geomonas subterranea]